MTKEISRTGVKNESRYQGWHMREETGGVSLNAYQRRGGSLQIIATEATDKTTRRVSVMLQPEAVRSLLEYLREWQEINQPKTNGHAQGVAEVASGDAR
jgi:hypothetical protein